MNEWTTWNIILTGFMRFTHIFCSWKRQSTGRIRRKEKEKGEEKIMDSDWGVWVSVCLVSHAVLWYIKQSTLFKDCVWISESIGDVSSHSSIITAHQQWHTSVRAKDYATCNYTGFSLWCRAFFQPLIISLFDDERSKKGS